MSDLLPPEMIESKILFIRGKKVMLDRDLAELYNVETRALVQAVKRNIDRFPDDFMFQLTKEELRDWKSQIVISNSVKMGLRKLPYAFTENGVAMLSSVLKSKRAVQVNIQIMRTFTKLREFLLTHKEFTQKFSQLERKYEWHDHQIQTIFDRMRKLSTPEEKHIKIKGFGKKEY